jgi:hypothetical protein
MTIDSPHERMRRHAGALAATLASSASRALARLSRRPPPPRGTLTGAACPDPADGTLSVVVPHTGIAAGTSLQVALGRFPGTGVADRDQVALAALRGRPITATRLAIRCG